MDRLGFEVERWAGRLERDSSVVVLFLGDNVYPSGVRAPGSEGYARDSLRLLSQVLALAGPEARRRGARGYFLAGNHDWGQDRGPSGLARLRNQAHLLDRFRAAGTLVRLLPEPGEPGPAAVDLPGAARFFFLDTQWWLQVPDQDEQDRALAALGALLEETETGEAVLATHHPWISGGMHGGYPLPFVGYPVYWLLRRTGTLLQDLNAPPYRDLRGDLQGLFARTGPPFLWVAGHDHNLQVIEGRAPDQPRWTLVSGSASDPRGVGAVEGMRWGGDEPGFMRLTWMESGAVHLHVLATRRGHAVCEGDPRDVRACMEAGRAAFRVVYATTLRDGRHDSRGTHPANRTPRP